MLANNLFQNFFAVTNDVIGNRKIDKKLELRIDLKQSQSQSKKQLALPFSYKFIKLNELEYNCPLKPLNHWLITEICL
jgi:hypothetical protein